MTIPLIALAISVIAMTAAILHAASQGYLSAPEKYGHPLKPRDPTDTEPWDAYMASRRLWHSVVQFTVCVAVGLTIGEVFLY